MKNTESVDDVHRLPHYHPSVTLHLLAISCDSRHGREFRRGSLACVGMHCALLAEWFQAVFLRTGVLVSQSSPHMACVCQQWGCRVVGYIYITYSETYYMTYCITLLYKLLYDLLYDSLYDLLYDLLYNLLYNLLYDLLQNLLYNLLYNLLVNHIIAVLFS